MRDRVVWDNLAKARLVDAWLAASDRAGTTEEFELFEERIVRAPSRVGWPYEEAILPDSAMLDVIFRADGLPDGSRAVRLSEAVVLFSVSEDDRTVWVWTVVFGDAA